MNGKNIVLTLFLILSNLGDLQSQHSIAREWNEALLLAIRNDFARPTVHARNLFHSSALMYDAWAVYNEQAETYFLGKSIKGFECPFNGIQEPTNFQSAQETTISYALYRLIKHRFEFSPGVDTIYSSIDDLMDKYNYDTDFISTDYSTGSPAALGNYMASKMIEFGLQDGSNEEFDYFNFYYTPVNPPLVTNNPGNPNISDYNRWQPLTLDEFIDQAGNPIPFNTPEFLSPEWGWVTPFSLQDSTLSAFERDSDPYLVYHDPGPPPYLNLTDTGGLSEEYKWGFSLVAAWSSHLDPVDSIMWDISPGALGNLQEFPKSFYDYDDFYQLLNGGDIGRGHSINPITGKAYVPQIVPRADYARVLAEFWADGPDSETPPGHWFTILNHVNDHPLLEKKYRGKGEIIDDLEWDVKAYFILGGAMHDCAISTWGIKGYYDYLRPISAIRAMADLGQSSNPNLPSYHPGGIHLIPDLIELVTIDDLSKGFDSTDVNKIKLLAWRGPDYILDSEIDYAGVGWILAENWWPYQRPSFVSPPFGGYVSGHSTFSRGAAEVLTLLTGDSFFPGGMGEFIAKKNEFLVFEEGPSVDIKLQWATYQDAADQTSLSRIWGGIHPPQDDIPGRIIGKRIGIDAFNYAEQFFNIPILTSVNESKRTYEIEVFPNPVENYISIKSKTPENIQFTLFNSFGQSLIQQNSFSVNYGRQIDLKKFPVGVYYLQIRDTFGKIIDTKKIIKGK